MRRNGDSRKGNFSGAPPTSVATWLGATHKQVDADRVLSDLVPPPRMDSHQRRHSLQDAMKDFERATMRKVSWRLLPLIFVLYVANYLDRTNVGLAALQMNKDLGLSAAAYGFGAGVFFIGYGLFEVPSNLFLARVGARRWIARIAITWGVLACAMMFVRGPASFYFIRFLLGAAEAGCFPGIVYYLSNWFPERQRASAMSRFMVSVPLAGMVGGPLGGALLSLTGRLGLAGWQWLYLVEGIPSIVIGAAVLFSFTDRPEDAGWLTLAEREWLVSRLSAERTARAAVTETSVVKALASPIVWWLAVLYFLTISAYLGVIFFGPTFVADATGMSNSKVGLVMGGVGLAGAVGTLANSVLSDRKEERIWHSIAAILIMVLGFVAGTLSQSGGGIIAGLALVSLGFNAFMPVFWCLPSRVLVGSAAAGGIALINSIGNLGGFFAPNIVGIAKQTTGGYSGALVTLGVMSLAAAAMTLVLRRLPALGGGSTQGEEVHDLARDPS